MAEGTKDPCKKEDGVASNKEGLNTTVESAKLLQ